MDFYAVMGNPIAHSQSPLIHTAFAQQTGQVLQYNAILVNTSKFVVAVKTFQALEGKGLNVTVPFKQAAWTLAEQRSTHAELAGAVNTLWFNEQGVCYGENTDGIGLVRDLTQNHGCQIEGQRVLILGAGGAVRGVLEPLLAAAPAQCVIANRTISKAKTLANLFATLGNITTSPYNALPGQSFDIIINGTSASLQGQLPPLPKTLLTPGGWCYDMMYASTPTLFMQWAKKQGAAYVLDGLGMLVEQAAESFYLWRGVKPETAPVIQKVRKQIIS
ncbi:MAG: shikimate dehydrogenase [Gammaproteobacteria bacterium]|nr:MAG: shikimate dehydrogenase [Gammaproteobacteria bacterium]RKZ43150.1 MAG: shikimate dehydrogenase [Gammaproteobacteria bacterium]RKZ75876.1 MAG: shikimate dehydrogenase [Gammaproteobacteria bacterium]